MSTKRQQPEQLEPPLFIVFEGIDGSGKTTQARMLADRLASRGVRVLFTAEPSDGPVGLLIKSMKRRAQPEEEARLFTEDRQDHLQRTIIPDLEQGITVICDRYVYSSVAYQGARGIAPGAILEENRAFALEADVTFLLEIEVDLAMERIASGRKNAFSTFEIRSDLEKVDAIYRSLTDPRLIRINGGGSPDEVHELILEQLYRVAFKQVRCVRGWRCPERSD
jgi:dTMP kinase